MATYYCANAGSNLNNGTSPATPFATLTFAITQALAGDSILLNGGDTFTENVTIAVGLALLSSYGNGLATVISASSSSRTVVFQPTPPTAVTNINFQGTTSAYPNSGTDIVGIFTTGTGVFATGVTVTGCTFSNGPRYGLYFAHLSADNGGITGITVSNNTFHDIGFGGLFTFSGGVLGTNFNYSNLSINNNTFYNILGNTSASGSGGGWGVVLQFINTSAGPSLFHDNIIHDCGVNVNSALSGGGTAFQCEGCNGLQIYNNLAYNLFNTPAATSDGGEGIDIDVSNSNCVAYNNYIFNADGAGLACYSNGGTFTGNVFHHNICVNVARNTPFGGIYISGTSPYTFYANTVIANGAKPCFTFGPSIAATCKILNNAFVAPAGIPTVSIPSGTTITGMTMDGNYHQSGDGLFASVNAAGTTFTTLATWKSNTGFETSGVAAGHCYFTQPQPPPTTLAGAAALAPASSSSPLINAGANLSGTYSITPAADFLGNAWTQNSIGAIYVAGTPTTYAAALYALNPLSFWRGAEPSGTTAYDSIGTLEAGTYNAVTLGGTTLVPGDGSPASGSYNGSSSGMTGVLTTHTYSYTALTVIAWINPTVVNLATGNTIATSYDAALSHNDWTLRLLNAAVSYFVEDSSGNSCAGQLNGFSLTAGTPVMLAATWATPNTMSIYVNGVSQTVTQTISASPAAATIKQVAIGINPPTPNRWFEGALSDVAVFSSALTGAQIAALYSAGSTPPPGPASSGGAPLLMANA
jgi:hypothetical protein